MKPAISFAVFVFFMALLVVTMVEWASGCGETWVDSKGAEHVGECWIVR